MAWRGIRAVGGFVTMTSSGMLVVYGFGRLSNAQSRRNRQEWQKPRPGVGLRRLFLNQEFDDGFSPSATAFSEMQPA